MASADSARTNQAALTAARGILGHLVPDDVTTDVVEAVRPHIERPYQLALQQAQAEIAYLKEQLKQ